MPPTPGQRAKRRYISLISSALTHHRVQVATPNCEGRPFEVEHVEHFREMKLHWELSSPYLGLIPGRLCRLLSLVWAPLLYLFAHQSHNTCRASLWLTQNS